VEGLGVDSLGTFGDCLRMDTWEEREKMQEGKQSCQLGPSLPHSTFGKIGEGALYSEQTQLGPGHGT
jgi:hypothetical protein